MTRHFFLICFGLACLLQAGPVSAQTSSDGSWPEDPDLGDYQAWAVEHHPALAAQRQRAAAERQDATSVGALPELRLAWGEMLVPVETRVGPQQRILSVSQSLPWFGTLGLREDAAGATADATEAAVAWQELDIRQEVAAAWYRLGALRAEAQLVAASRDLVDDRTAWLRRAYEADAAAYTDVLQAEMELGRLVTRDDGLVDRERPLTALLNTAAGRPLDAPAPAADLPPAQVLAGDLPPVEELRAHLDANHPRLRALDHRRESRRLGSEAAGRSGKPTFSLGLDWIMTDPARVPDVPDSGKDPVIARVAVQIPLWNGSAGAQKQAAHGRLRSAELELSDARRELEARLETVLYAWREAGRGMALYEETLLPRGRQAVDVTIAGYEADQRSFADVLAVRRELLALESAAVSLRLDRALALNDLAHLLGLPAAALTGNANLKDDSS